MDIQGMGFLPLKIRTEEKHISRHLLVVCYLCRALSCSSVSFDEVPYSSPCPATWLLGLLCSSTRQHCSAYMFTRAGLPRVDVWTLRYTRLPVVYRCSSVDRVARHTVCVQKYVLFCFCELLPLLACLLESITTSLS